MQHQRLEDTSFCQNSLVNKTGCIAGTLPIKHLPSDNFPTEHIHNHIKIKEHAVNGSGQPRNIPRPNLVRAGGTKSLGWHAFSRFLTAAPMVLFVGLVKNPVKTRLRGNILALVRQFGHNLRRRQAGIFLLMTYIQNALPFLLSQLVSWRRPSGIRTFILGDASIFCPTLVGPGADFQNLAGGYQPRPIPTGLLNQLNASTAIRFSL